MEVLSLEGGIVRVGKAFENLNRTSLVMGAGLAVLSGTTTLFGLKNVTDQAKELTHEFHGAQGHHMPFCSAIL